MADVMSVQQRSRVMGRNQAKNTSPERYMNDLLEVTGLQFSRNDAALPGKPDFVFHGNKVAVFVDGDFWHGWRFPIWEHRMAPFWREKIAKTRLRDQRNFRKLRQQGWSVIRIWEHQIEDDLIGCVCRIAAAVQHSVDLIAIQARRDTMPTLKRRKRLPKP